nr:unnamed protein product [Digitaria exilis]
MQHGWRTKELDKGTVSRGGRIAPFFPSTARLGGCGPLELAPPSQSCYRLVLLPPPQGSFGHAATAGYLAPAPP